MRPHRIHRTDSSIVTVMHEFRDARPGEAADQMANSPGFFDGGIVRISSQAEGRANSFATSVFRLSSPAWPGNLLKTESKTFERMTLPLVTSWHAI